MESIIELRKKTGVLVAAHRGTSGGNIPPNSIAAFDIALKEGADILEMDLFQSIDGELFVFHTGMEPSHLDRHIRIERYTAGEIRQMRLCNGDLQQTFLPVNSFDDVLEHLKGKCKLNLDRSINIIEPVMKAVKKHGMEDQILMKSDPSDQSLKLIEAYAPTIDYMPIFMEEDLASDKIEKMNINYIGAEIVFEKETSPVIQESYLEMQKKYPVIGDVRGLGGMIGIEFVKDQETKEPDAAFTSDLIQTCAKKGLLVEGAGTYNNVIRFLAPLVMTDEQLAAGLDIFEASIKECLKH